MSLLLQETSIGERSKRRMKEVISWGKRKRKDGVKGRKRKTNEAEHKRQRM